MTKATTVIEPFLTPQQTADLLAIPLKTLRDLEYRRVGPPSHKIGRHRRYRASEVVAWATSPH